MICPRSEPHCLSRATVRRGPATAIHTVPTGFSAVPPAGPAMPVVETGVVGAADASRPFGHLSGDLFADGAVTGDRVGIDSQHSLLRRVAVRNHAAEEVG